VLVGLSTAAGAQEPRVYLFWGVTCPHSQAARAFLLKQHALDPAMQLAELETESNIVHAIVLARLYQKIGLAGLSAVPTIVIGTNITIGYIDDDTTGRELIHSLAICRKEGCPDMIERLLLELNEPEQVRAFDRPVCRAVSELQKLR
jgi:hypothetical protein